MQSYFASNGVETPMTNRAFDLLWNSSPDTEVTDSEWSSSSGEGDTPNSSVEAPNSTGYADVQAQACRVLAE